MCYLKKLEKKMVLDLHFKKYIKILYIFLTLKVKGTILCIEKLYIKILYIGGDSCIFQHLLP